MGILGTWLKSLSLRSLRLSFPSESSGVLGLEELRVPKFLTACPLTWTLTLKTQVCHGLTFFSHPETFEFEWCVLVHLVRNSYNFSANAELEAQINVTPPVDL